MSRRVIDQTEIRTLREMVAELFFVRHRDTYAIGCELGMDEAEVERILNRIMDERI